MDCSYIFKLLSLPDDENHLSVLDNVESCWRYEICLYSKTAYPLTALTAHAG